MKMVSAQECQSVEWKWSWQDEFLKWLCGYANTDGGTIYIGVNDDGYVVGLKDSKSLLESLPNKIADKLGVLASVRLYTVARGTNLRYGDDVPAAVAGKLLNQYARGMVRAGHCGQEERHTKILSKLEQENPIWILEDGEVEYIEVSVPRYPFAISCDGKYYKRSGSTLRELNGFELQNFLLERAGLTWDALPLPDVCISDLSREALDAFRRRAVMKGRMTEAEASVSDEVLLRNLKLFEKGRLIRAAVLMFHPDPERYVTGAYIKIAYFAPAGAYGQNKVDDIIYFDDVHGPLMLQVDKAIDLIYTKYLKALISYDGLQRIETFLWPREGFREILLNSVNHKRYERGIPIQIRVYDDKITIWNDGQWPREIDVLKIYERHPSLPYNPKVADVFYRAGDIEAWGSGFDKIRLECDKSLSPYPIISAGLNGGVELECDACELYMNLLKHGRYYDTYPKPNRETWEDFSVLGDGGAVKYGTNEKEPMVGFKRGTAGEDWREPEDRMMVILNDKLSEREKKKLMPIVDFLKTHDKITRWQAEQVSGKSLSTVTRYLRRLEELDVLVRDGQSVATVYRRT